MMRNAEIEKAEIEKAVKELENAKSVKLEIEMSAQEAYSLIVAFQLFKAKGNNLQKTVIVGEVAARQLDRSLIEPCPSIYQILENGWEFTEKKPKNN